MVIFAVSFTTFFVTLVAFFLTIFVAFAVTLSATFLAGFVIILLELFSKLFRPPSFVAVFNVFPVFTNLLAVLLITLTPFIAVAIFPFILPFLEPKSFTSFSFSTASSSVSSVFIVFNLPVF